MVFWVALLVIAIVVSFAWVASRGPDCPRVQMGYKCHENYPGGCEECGRKVL